MYKFVIFDLDGTLANTLEDLANGVNYALEKNGFKTYPADDYRYFVGNGIINLIRRTLGSRGIDDELVKRVKADFDYMYGKHSMDKTVAYDGIYDMLKVLQGKNIKLAVLSNKPHTFVGDILNKLFADVEFSAAWGKKDEFKVKPDPQSLYAIMNEIGADKENSLYVGDSDVDVKTAVNGGVDFAGAQWGFRGKEELAAAGAENTFEDAKALERFILNGGK